MLRRTLKSLKPLTFALIVLVLTPCIAEFAMRVSMCTSQLETKLASSGLTVAASWHTHHELEPLQRTRVQSDETGLPIELRTNSISLRGPEITIPKPAGTLRVLCLGDEVVLGAAVDEPQTFCHLVQQILQKRSTKRVEVINAGVPDFCPLLSYLQLRHRLLVLNPDVIVAHFDMSDVWDDRHFRRLTELGQQEEPLLCSNPSLSATPMTKPLAENFLCWQWAEGKLSGLVGQKHRVDTSSVDDPRARYAWLTDDSSLWQLQTKLALSPVTHLARLCQEQNIRLLFAAHPAPWQLSGTASRAARIPESNGIYPGTFIESTEAEVLLATFARSRALPFCDVISLMRRQASPDELFQHDSVEFSEAGHRYYAVALADSLRKSFPNVFPPASIYPRIQRPSQFSNAEPRSPSGRQPEQPIALEPIRPVGFDTQPQGSMNRTSDATTERTDRQHRQNTRPNDLGPIYRRR